jgi:hypothetical protein
MGLGNLPTSAGQDKQDNFPKLNIRVSCPFPLNPEDKTDKTEKTYLIIFYIHILKL